MQTAAYGTRASRSWWTWGVALALALSTSICVVFSVADADVPVDGYEVVNVFPHDADAFCQGLVFDDGVLYEGTGLYGQSSLRKVELETGRVVKNLRISRRYFGEGITIWGDRIVQLTWKSRYGFVYDKDSFQLLDRFRYAGQGWGITHDGRSLIVSDGSSRLRFLDPNTFDVVKWLHVTAGGRDVDKLNELEYVDGEIFANVWKSDFLARINPETGSVTRWVDLSGLMPRRGRAADQQVLNGIAYDAEHRRLFVTGKDWPKLFEIRIVSRQSGR